MSDPRVSLVCLLALASSAMAACSSATDAAVPSFIANASESDGGDDDEAEATDDAQLDAGVTRSRDSGSASKDAGAKRDAASSSDASPPPSPPPSLDAGVPSPVPDAAPPSTGSCTSPWTSTEIVSDDVSDLAVAVDGAGTLHVAFFDSSVLRTRYLTRPAGSTTWTSTTLSSQNDVKGYGTAITTDAAGGVHVFHGTYWYDHKPPGGSFQAQSLNNALLHSPAIAVAANGTVHIAGYAVASSTLRYLGRGTNGTWSHADIESTSSIPYVDAEQYATVTRSEIGVDGAGVVRVMYRMNGPLIRLAERSASGTWATADFAKGDALAMHVDTNGTVHSTFRAGPLFGGHLAYGRKPAGQAVQSSGTGETDLALGWSSLFVDAAGNRHAAYASASGLNASTSYVRYGVLAAGSTSWSFQTVDTSMYGVRQTNTKIVVDPAGEPHMFFVDELGALNLVEPCH